MFFILSNSIEDEEITFSLQEIANKKTSWEFPRVRNFISDFMWTLDLQKSFDLGLQSKCLFRDSSTHHSYPLH